MDRTEFLSREPDLALAKQLNRGVILITLLVLVLVGAMRQIKIPLPEGLRTDFLPPLYSLINVAVAVLLVGALLAIRRGHVIWHRRLIHFALGGSAAFLVGYVVYHFTNEEIRFEGAGPVRAGYLVLLVSHVILAAVSLPFILYTWVLALTHQFERHRRLARFVFPVWLYVAVSGPVCYVLLHWLGRGGG